MLCSCSGFPFKQGGYLGYMKPTANLTQAELAASICGENVKQEFLCSFDGEGREKASEKPK